MSDAAGSSITDLLINQPVLVWSLAGGLAILVIAGLLSVFLALRSSFKTGQAAKEALREQRKREAHLETAVEAATSKKATPVRPSEIEQRPVGRETPIAADQKGFLLLGESTETLDIDEETLEELAAPEEEDIAEEPKEENSLAALFSADSIVDPYVQALRDHLQVISIDELLNNVRSVSHELQEQINADHAAKN